MLTLDGGVRLWQVLVSESSIKGGYLALTLLFANRIMIKSELIAKLAKDNPHLYQRDVELIVSTFFDSITDALARGERVELRGFGAFSVKKREARVGRNPKTGEAVQVEVKYTPHFKTGKDLRERLNGK